MIALAPAPESRAAIDGAIDSALDRIRARALPLGDGITVLAEATARAATGGKRFRPALVAASFTAFGGDAAAHPALYSVAAAFELLHTAFVVHDDVIDRDTERRGIPNIVGEFRTRGRSRGADADGAALLGDAAAILAGDLLLHEASRLIALADVGASVREQLFALLDDAVLVSAAGELADVEHAIAGDLADPAAILAAAHDKTAVYSFSAPLRAGAVLAEADSATLARLDRAGSSLGLAFQLVDDLIGAFGSSTQAGREPGVDLRESKRTPLVALARESTTWPEVTRTLALAHTGPVAVAAAQDALENSGARARLLALIHTTLAEVRTIATEELLTPAAQQLLTHLAESVEARIP